MQFRRGRVRFALGTVALIALITLLGVKAITKNQYLATGDFDTVSPRPADSLADFVGVNVHELWTSNQYEQIYKPRLREARIRYIRGDMLNMQISILDKLVELSNPTDTNLPPIKYLGISTYRSQYPGSALNDCFGALIKTMIKGGTLPCGPSQGQTLKKPIKFAGVEGPNEVDHCVSNDPVCQPKLPPNPTWWQDAEANNPNWIADTENTVRNIWTKLKSDPATANIAIVAPTFVYMNKYQTQPYPPYGDLYGRFLNLRQYFDYGNVHVYCGKYPLNTNCLNANQSYNKMAEFSGKPMLVTETGFHTNPSLGWHVSETVQEKYGMRELLDFYDMGVKQAYVYQLIDEVTSPGIGILRLDGSPKPFFNSIKGLNLLLDDRGSTFSPKSFSYRLGGDASQVKATFLQKRDGTVFIALRHSTASSSDSIASKSVTVSFPQAANGTLYDVSSPTPTKTFNSETTFNVAVPDRVVFLKVVNTSEGANSSGATGSSSSGSNQVTGTNSDKSQAGNTGNKSKTTQNPAEELADLLLPDFLVESTSSKEIATAITFGSFFTLFLLVLAVVRLWHHFMNKSRDRRL